MSHPAAPWTAPDLAAFEAMAIAAREALPDPFRQAAGNVILRIEDFPPAEVLRDLRIEDPFELTGLYDGIPLTEKASLDQPMQPDAIWLFRRPILDEWAARGTEPLGHLIAHVYVHELAHHFGWSDEDIAKIDQWWD
ncbi:MAG: metallopeptidase family protein [Pseudomonadota bacterium]